ncbi:hypothetical protein L1049_022976 [Liquidambar formosana]|uniref:Uncharacterized protein n=1 Tax=Liquidambar formosana TaxID=63359 RepID=A0AAP0WRY5_LIQFO
MVSKNFPPSTSLSPLSLPHHLSVPSSEPGGRRSAALTRVKLFIQYHQYKASLKLVSEANKKRKKDNPCGYRKVSSAVLLVRVVELHSRLQIWMLLVMWSWTLIFDKLDTYELV